MHFDCIDPQHIEIRETFEKVLKTIFNTIFILWITQNFWSVTNLPLNNTQWSEIIFEGALMYLGIIYILFIYLCASVIFFRTSAINKILRNKYVFCKNASAWKVRIFLQKWFHTIEFYVSILNHFFSSIRPEILKCTCKYVRLDVINLICSIKIK